MESFLQLLFISFNSYSSYRSQSLFYWNPFCNNLQYGFLMNILTCRNPYFIGILSAIKKWCSICSWTAGVAILILLESFLQLSESVLKNHTIISRNPYFIGILSAIKRAYCPPYSYAHVAILILLESFLQSLRVIHFSDFESGRNPYFIGILSAIAFQ